ncbi:mitochondrial inner membrane translocase subunit Tim13 [Chloropicon roscoffensis]|uniref:Mitochondrial import inner membrane translocase subunit n=1 Tax=Chloropicon roscoffensis TaxID=1461544 RepID=A0AAX4PHS0_9CHLO|mmetsp:Transcript_2875/g.8674  ORF Transcript_2875/g.8674 Transcript_2875/m.8674 type:complete len:88 (-) Transcript_2875:91-354(-)|eukprot:CAMPEP_0198470552 /NCGR_PEP_ID=MMETSP1456-20131121/18095_1 /TAXON_ID=1461544 ORGANISM="Unidentified sp., Strain RCC1871" /NCGR_SAMPLE_ID=MMETSP1456 /ASSEMBLY_ACC=CAM_ASM_001119 /LENGTH=87 /DNA_ID=CAMNT_0044197055 /DNA_START=101 /DNA_END=364 /DNA_ORIENTATION=+
MDFAGGQSVQMPSESDMMHQVKAELATAYAQEFYNTVRDKCFKACVTSPSSSLSSSERTCLERCVDRYVEATQVVSQSAIKALQGHS